MKSLSGRFLLVIGLVVVLVGMGWLQQRTSTPSESCCGVDATCPSTPDDLNKTAGSTEVQKPAVVSIPKSSTKVLPKLIDLGSTTCTPCKMMTPILDDLSKRFNGKLEVEFIDVTKNRDAASQYGIQVIPTQIFFDDKGEEFYRHSGFYSKEAILKVFEDNGIKLSSGVK